MNPDWKCFGCNKIISGNRFGYWLCANCNLLLTLNDDEISYTLSRKWVFIGSGSLDLCERAYKLISFL